MIDNLIKIVSSSLKVKQGIAKAIVLSAIALAVVLSCVAVKSCYDNSVVEKHEQEIQNDILKDKVVADEKASEQRAQDTIRNAKESRERSDAINETESQPLPDSSLALGCQRLRQQGYDTSNYSECSGH